MKTSLLSSISVTAPDDLDPNQAIYKFHSKVEGKEIAIESGLHHQPSGIVSAAIKAGIKYPDVYDLTIVKLPKRGPAAGIFTKNRSASPSVIIDRENLKDGFAQALVVISKNANVFTTTAFDDTQAIINQVATTLDVQPTDVMVSCTGVIGVPLPLDKASAGISKFKEAAKPGLIDEVASSILTTDRGPKTCCVKFGNIVLAGMAKGAGMIEPNMATMLVYFFTNLNLSSNKLRSIVTKASDETFNSISVDTDTSTSDSLIVFSTGEVESTPELEEDFTKALTALSTKLSRDIVYQAEGATRLIQATVNGSISEDNARQVSKFIINSPLVKTAIFGADPNWGRIVMAIGKPGQSQTETIDPLKIKISINDFVMFEKGRADVSKLKEVSQSIKDRKQTNIDVNLGEGSSSWTSWGCDLTYEYVKENAEYTT
jgi:glutamate N-acetyltransferase/amino-acid N-acetyltransferase